MLSQTNHEFNDEVVGQIPLADKEYSEFLNVKGEVRNTLKKLLYGVEKRTLSPKGIECLQTALCNWMVLNKPSVTSLNSCSMTASTAASEVVVNLVRNLQSVVTKINSEKQEEPISKDVVIDNKNIMSSITSLLDACSNEEANVVINVLENTRRFINDAMDSENILVNAKITGDIVESVLKLITSHCCAKKHNPMKEGDNNRKKNERDLENEQKTKTGQCSGNKDTYTRVQKKNLKYPETDDSQICKYMCQPLNSTRCENAEMQSGAGTRLKERNETLLYGGDKQANLHERSRTRKCSKCSQTLTDSEAPSVTELEERHAGIRRNNKQKLDKHKTRTVCSTRQFNSPVPRCPCIHRCSQRIQTSETPGKSSTEYIGNSVAQSLLWATIEYGHLHISEMKQNYLWNMTRIAVDSLVDKFKREERNNPDYIPGTQGLDIIKTVLVQILKNAFVSRISHETIHTIVNVCAPEIGKLFNKYRDSVEEYYASSSGSSYGTDMSDTVWDIESVVDEAVFSTIKTIICEIKKGVEHLVDVRSQVLPPTHYPESNVLPYNINDSVAEIRLMRHADSSSLGLQSRKKFEKSQMPDYPDKKDHKPAIQKNVRINTKVGERPVKPTTEECHKELLKNIKEILRMAIEKKNIEKDNNKEQKNKIKRGDTEKNNIPEYNISEDTYSLENRYVSKQRSEDQDDEHENLKIKRISSVEDDNTKQRPSEDQDVKYENLKIKRISIVEDDSIKQSRDENTTKVESRRLSDASASYNSFSRARCYSEGMQTFCIEAYDHNGEIIERVVSDEQREDKEALFNMTPISYDENKISDLSDKLIQRQEFEGEVHVTFQQLDEIVKDVVAHVSHVPDTIQNNQVELENTNVDLKSRSGQNADDIGSGQESHKDAQSQNEDNEISILHISNSLKELQIKAQSTLSHAMDEIRAGSLDAAELAQIVDNFNTKISQSNMQYDLASNEANQTRDSIADGAYDTLEKRESPIKEGLKIYSNKLKQDAEIYAMQLRETTTTCVKNIKDEMSDFLNQFKQEVSDPSRAGPRCSTKSSVPFNKETKSNVILKGIPEKYEFPLNLNPSGKENRVANSQRRHTWQEVYNSTHTEPFRRAVNVTTSLTHDTHNTPTLLTATNSGEGEGDILANPIMTFDSASRSFDPKKYNTEWPFEESLYGMKRCMKAALSAASAKSSKFLNSMDKSVNFSGILPNSGSTDVSLSSETELVSQKDEPRRYSAPLSRHFKKRIQEYNYACDQSDSLVESDATIPGNLDDSIFDLNENNAELITIAERSKCLEVYLPNEGKCYDVEGTNNTSLTDGASSNEHGGQTCTRDSSCDTDTDETDDMFSQNTGEFATKYIQDGSLYTREHAIDDLVVANQFELWENPTAINTTSGCDEVTSETSGNCVFSYPTVFSSEGEQMKNTPVNNKEGVSYESVEVTEDQTVVVNIEESVVNNVDITHRDLNKPCVRNNNSFETLQDELIRRISDDSRTRIGEENINESIPKEKSKRSRKCGRKIGTTPYTTDEQRAKVVNDLLNIAGLSTKTKQSGAKANRAPNQLILSPYLHDISKLRRPAKLKNHQVASTKSANVSRSVCVYKSKADNKCISSVVAESSSIEQKTIASKTLKKSGIKHNNSQVAKRKIKSRKLIAEDENNSQNES